MRFESLKRNFRGTLEKQGCIMDRKKAWFVHFKIPYISHPQFPIRLIRCPTPAWKMTMFLLKKGISKLINKLGHVHKKIQLITINTFCYHVTITQLLTRIRNYLSIALFLPNLCLTFPAGTSCFAIKLHICQINRYEQKHICQMCNF